VIWRTQATQAFADAVDGRRPAKGEVAELVALATRLCEIAAETEPTPEFRTTLRAQLMTSAVPVRLVTRAAPKVRSLRRRTATVAALLATSFGGVGMAAASAATIPGEVLYPVKRVIEDSQLAFKFSDSSRGAYHLQLATERLAEVNDLAIDPTSSIQATEETFNEFQRQANAGSEALMRSYLANDSHDDLVVLNRFSRVSARQLNELRGHLSVTDLQQAQSLLDGLAARSTLMCPECRGSGAIESANAASQAPTDVPTSIITPENLAISGTATPTPGKASPTPTIKSTSDGSPVPAELPTATLPTSPPPVADLVKKTVDAPGQQVQDLKLLKNLQDGGDKLLKLSDDN
jgi:hypothetical protein